MLSKLSNPLTTAMPVGVAIRYLGTILTTALTVVAMLGWISQEQADELIAMMPELLGALTGLIMLGIPAYAIMTKSSSDRGAEVAKESDAKIPKDDPVVIETPGNRPNIIVPPTP